MRKRTGQSCFQCPSSNIFSYLLKDILNVKQNAALNPSIIPFSLKTEIQYFQLSPEHNRTQTIKDGF